MKGGHCNITHVDEGALRFLQREYGVESMIDVGCGPGGMQPAATALGIEWAGVDADDVCARPGFRVWDFERGAWPLWGRWDLGWSVEFLEHVEERAIPNYLPVFRNCKVVVATHSEKPGPYHVTLRSSDWWDGVFAAIGLIRDEEATRALRAESTMVREFIQTNGRVYR